MDQQIWKGPLYRAKDKNATICDRRRCMLVSDAVIRDDATGASECGGGGGGVGGRCGGGAAGDAAAAAAGAKGSTFQFSFVLHQKRTPTYTGGSATYLHSELYSLPSLQPLSSRRAPGGSSNVGGSIGGGMSGGPSGRASGGTGGASGGTGGMSGIRSRGASGRASEGTGGVSSIRSRGASGRVAPTHSNLHE